jgi:SAM-dependent methyltransferase
MACNQDLIRSYDDWLHTPTGRLIDERRKKFICDLISPKGGERLLDVGCGTGHHMSFFRTKDCLVTGVERSMDMLNVARQKFGDQGDFYLGDAENLPFSDNEFDLVTLIFTLETSNDPERVISEAIRVCRGRIFLGVLNKYPLSRSYRNIRAFHSPSAQAPFRFYHMAELTRMIKYQLGAASIRWGSVFFFPCPWYGIAHRLDEFIPVRKNPFGAFLGLSFPVTYRYMTIQEPIRSSYQVKKSRHPVPGVVREINKKNAGSNAL